MAPVNKTNSRGQASVETCLLMIPCAALVVGFLGWMYFETLHSWSDYWMYRATICMAQERSRSTCERELSEKLKFFASPSLFKEVRVWKTRNAATAEVTYESKGMSSFLRGPRGVHSIVTRLPLPSH